MKFIVLSILTLSSSFALAKKENTATTGGRFQLIQLSDMRRDQLLLDSQTGKMWSPLCLTSDQNGAECAYAAWSVVEIEGITITKKEISEKARAIEAFIKEQKENK